MNLLQQLLHGLPARTLSDSTAPPCCWCCTAGDFLAGLDLESAAPDKPLDLFARPAPPSAAALSALSQQPAAPQTLVELGLTALLRIAGAGGRAAGQLYRLDALGLCEALWPYTSPAVVELAQRLCAALAGR